MANLYIKNISLFRLSYWWLLVLPAALVTWASSSAPEMHHFVRPVATTVWQLAPLPDAASAQALQTRLASEPGVSACAVSARTNCVAFVYHPQEATPTALYEAVSRNGARVLEAPLPASAAPAGRQCPVPPGYFQFVDDLRFALNLRRLFVTV
jgi:hypothetical protein